jgi:hypothetical protein
LPAQTGQPARTESSMVPHLAVIIVLIVLVAGLVTSRKK